MAANELPEFDLTKALEGVSHDHKWDVLKPELEVLFSLGRKYADIARLMKEKYTFDAQGPAYKYRFEKWGWKRNLPSTKKDQILQHIERRAVTGKRSAVVFGNTPVDAKKLKRHVTTVQRGASHQTRFEYPSSAQSTVPGIFLPFGLRPFAIWNVPLGGHLTGEDLLAIANTPSDVEIHTPHSSYPSPEAGPSAMDVMNPPSPLSTAVLARASSERTSLFLKGQLEKLERSMNGEQRRILSNWLYDFWLFGFKTCKYWNNKSPDLTGNHNAAPKNSTGLSIDIFSPSAPRTAASPVQTAIQAPSTLCRWTIHLGEEQFSFEDAPVHEEAVAHQKLSILEEFAHGMKHNSFSAIDPTAVPLNLSSISHAVERSSELMFEEALCFAIMAGNENALNDLLSKRQYEAGQEALTNISAMHVATSYLNGGQVCCNIFSRVCASIDILKAYRNALGHTVLDSLMLTILKNHSSTPIGKVDDSLGRRANYAGIDVDICGRWDADSDCFRSLVASGEMNIPHAWKHKFCHTSVQAICHCIQTLNQRYLGCKKQRSGLFQKLCTNCGLKLQLPPLHALIMTGFELANNAYEDEDLFGIAACLLCLLSAGADPSERADISIPALLGQNIDQNGCSHSTMTPYDLVQNIAHAGRDSWSKLSRTGWDLILQICSRALMAREAFNTSGPAQGDRFNVYKHTYDVMARLYDCGLDQCGLRCRTHDYKGFKPPFGMDLQLIHLYGSVQAEFLTYRRLDEDKPWLSPNFDMAKITKDLEQGALLETGFTRKGLLHKYCACGQYRPASMSSFPTREQVMKEYCSNMECWHRTSFISQPTWCGPLDQLTSFWAIPETSNHHRPDFVPPVFHVAT